MDVQQAAPAQESVRDGLSRIEERQNNFHMIHEPADWAASDVKDLSTLQGYQRTDAALLMAQNVAKDELYKEALETRAPEVAAEVAAIEAVELKRVAEKEERKAGDAEAMGLDQVLEAQEQRIAERDGAPGHPGTESSREAVRAGEMGGKMSGIDNAELDTLLAEQARRMDDQPGIKALADREEARLREAMMGVQGVTPEDTRAELMEHNEHRGQGKVAEGERLEEALRREREAQQRGENEKKSITAKEAREEARIERQQEPANSFDVQRTGRELGKGDFIMPRQIERGYTEIDGKFYTKDTNRVMFEDKGEKLATSTTDKAAIADMVALAKAKQWDSLKLAGSQEFRREAWLQAESQGIKTQGYTPKEADLASLETLRQARSTNLITPLQERTQDKAKAAGAEHELAPRNNLDKSQANLHAEATKNIATNMQTLQKIPGMSDKSTEELAKVAYWRGVVSEENKGQPKAQEEALARFDAKATDPAFVKALPQETEPRVQDRTTDRVQNHKLEIDGQSL